LPRDGLHHVARALSQALEGAGEQREDYWKNRIKPFWQYVWPKSRNLSSGPIADSLARLSIAAGRAFPSAFDAIKDWLQPLDHPHYVMRRLNEANLCEQFPLESLRLLSAIVKDQPWANPELQKCLHSIVQSNPSLQQDPQFRKLADYVRRHER
jgi:hypothetical protein